jgi:hypothetical protein
MEIKMSVTFSQVGYYAKFNAEDPLAVTVNQFKFVAIRDDANIDKINWEKNGDSTGTATAQDFLNMLFTMSEKLIEEISQGVYLALIQLGLAARAEKKGICWY